MNALLIHLKLDSPLLMTGVNSGDENSGRTQSYIPGGAIRGMLIERYLREQQVTDLPVDSKASELFFSDAIRFLNAYPAVNGVRSLPVPVSWRKEKGEKEETNSDIVDLALGENRDKKTNLTHQFYLQTDDGIAVFSPEKVLNLHIGGEERGRVTEENNPRNS